MVNGIGSHEIPQKSHQIKQDDKFFSRLVSKDTSLANSSSRVYYGGASGAIPFVWESQPGTPKHILFSDNSLPPLAPPPSYQSTFKSKTIQKKLKPNLLSIIFSRFSSKKNHVAPSSSWSCTSSSSSLSSMSSWSSLQQSYSKNSKFHGCKFFCSTLSINYGSDDDEENNLGPGSPT